MPGLLHLNLLRPDSPETQQLLERVRHHMGRDEALEVRPDQTVGLTFADHDHKAGARRIQSALETAASDLGLDWTDYFTFTVRFGA